MHGNLPWVWMSFISASGLPADHHQQLCNNPMAAKGAWDCGFDEPLYPGRASKFTSILSCALEYWWDLSVWE